MLTPEWKAWKQENDERKKSARRIGWFFAVFFALLFSIVAHGFYTGELKTRETKYGPDYEPDEITCSRSGWGGDC
jgi:hypothetical protein